MEDGLFHLKTNSRLRVVSVNGTCHAEVLVQLFFISKWSSSLCYALHDNGANLHHVHPCTRSTTHHLRMRTTCHQWTDEKQQPNHWHLLKKKHKCIERKNLRQFAFAPPHLRSIYVVLWTYMWWYASNKCVIHTKVKTSQVPFWSLNNKDFIIDAIKGLSISNIFP